jgi:hypothetical protein
MREEPERGRKSARPVRISARVLPEPKSLLEAPGCSEPRDSTILDLETLEWIAPRARQAHGGVRIADRLGTEQIKNLESNPLGYRSFGVQNKRQGRVGLVASIFDFGLPANGDVRAKLDREGVGLRTPRPGCGTERAAKVKE